MSYSSDRRHSQDRAAQPAAQRRGTASILDQRASATAHLQLKQKIDESPIADASRSIKQLMAEGELERAEPAQLMEDEDETLQGKFDGSGAAQLAESQEARPNDTGLPDNLKAGIENLSGMSMDHVKVRYNSSQPAQLNAHAYAQGSEIHLGPGQERHLPHEAWHVVQQAQGRVKPTMQMKAGIPVNDDIQLETEADVMGARALASEPKLVQSPDRPVSRLADSRSEAIAQTIRKKGNTVPIQLAILQAKWIDNGGQWWMWDKLENGRQWYLDKTTKKIFYIDGDGIESDQKSRGEWMELFGDGWGEHFKTDDLSDEVAAFLPLEESVSNETKSEVNLKICRYCAKEASDEVNAQKICKEGTQDRGYTTKHSMVKKRQEKLKYIPSKEEIAKLKENKKKEKREFFPQASSSSNNSEKSESAKTNEVEVKEIPHGCEYTSANTALLVKYCKLIHQIKQAIGDDAVDTALRKQAGVFFVKLNHFCDGLLIAINLTDVESLENSLDGTRDSEYIKKQKRFIDEGVRMLVALPGTVDFQSCDSAVIDLEQQYERALKVLGK